MQGACCHQLATTLYSPAARQQSSKQHRACAVVCPRCFAAVFYSVVAFYRILRSVELEVSAAVWCMHAATGMATLLLLLMLQCDVRGQPSVDESSNPSFDASFPISVNSIPLQLPYGCVPCATRVCVGVRRASRVDCFQNFFLSSVPGFLRERLSSP